MNRDNKQKVIYKHTTIGKYVLIVIVVIYFLILIMMPLYGVIKEAFSNGLVNFFTSITTPAARHSFYLTFWITISTCAINTLFGLILAVVIVKQNFRGKLLLEGLIDLPFAISPVIAGFMFIILFGHKGWIGNWFAGHNIKIIYAFWGMLIATLFVTLPFVAREIIPVLKEYGLNQEEAAYVLGASRWKTFWKVTLPSIKWGLAYGVILTIARSIGEFGAVLVVSGSIINKTQTATVFIHQEFTDYNFTGAFSAAVVLAIISLTILLIIQIVFKKKGNV